MRYIYYIIAILLVLSAVVFFRFYRQPEPPKGAALVINGRAITANELDKLYESQPARAMTRDEFANYLITEELLIQEAQKEGIDREESFRRSIQNFYEQSLVKLLVDRKFQDTPVTVSDEEVERQLALLHGKLHITVFSLDDPEKAKKGNPGQGQSRTVSYEDLSTDMKDALSGLQEGQSTAPILIGSEYKVIRLDRVERGEGTGGESKEEIRRMLTADKKKKMIDSWIDSLRKKASVSVLMKGKLERP